MKAREITDWGISDPKGDTPEDYSAARDEIERRVKELLDHLGKEYKNAG